MAPSNFQQGQQGNGRQLQTQPSGTTAQIKAQDQAALDMVKQANPYLYGRVIEIMLSQPANKPLSAPRALAAAMYERENPGRKLGRDFYVDEKMGIVSSYRGEKKDAEDDIGRDQFYTQPRSTTAEENAQHEVQPGDTARACDGYQFALMRRLQRAGIPYHPTTGIGIVRKHEKYSDTTVWDDSKRRMVKLPMEEWGPPIDPPVGKSWLWKADQRAYKDCLRHMPGVKLSAEILEDLEVEGLEAPPETVHLSQEQAQAWTNTRRADAAHQAERDAMPEAERHAQAQAHIEQMRGPASFQGFGDDDMPPPAEPPEVLEPITEPPVDDGYDPDADFGNIPGAVEEQINAAVAIVQRIMDDQPDGWDRSASETQLGALQGLLHKVAPNADDRQALVTFMSDGHLGSAAEASMGFAGALISAWTTVETLDTGKSRRVATDKAKAEAAQIIAAARLAQGQTPLFVETTATAESQ